MTYCPHCYRARNFVKDSMGRLFSRPYTHIEYTTDNGTYLLVERSTNKLVSCSGGFATHLIGVETYSGNGVLRVLTTGKAIALYVRKRKVHITSNTNL